MKYLKLMKRADYTIVQLKRDKANPINARMISEIRLLFRHLENDPKVRGVVLTGQENFFSAGLDLIEMYDLDERGIKTFWTNFMGMISDLVSFPKPLVAAITGHSPAGGCVLAICCDYRVMAKGRFTIGLNEIPIGIVLPETIFHLYSFWIGQHKAYQYLLEGELLNPAEALSVGLIDELVEENKVQIIAEQKLKKYLTFDSDTWQNSKMNIRKELIKKLDVDINTLLEPLLKQWWQPATRNRVAAMVKTLSRGKVNQTSRGSVNQTKGGANSNRRR